MSISLFSAAILLILITTTVIEVHHGMERGFFRTLLRLGALLLSIFVSLIVSPYLANSIIMGFFDIIPDLVTFFESLEDILSALVSSTGAAVSFEELILALESIDINSDPTIAPSLGIICALLSTVFSVILLLPLCGCFGAIIKLIARKKNISTFAAPQDHLGNHSFFHRNTTLLGGLTGGVIALLICMMVTAPVMGTLDVFVTIGDRLLAERPQFMSQIGIGNDGFEILKTCSKDLPGNLLYQFGGKYMYMTAAQGQIGEDMLYLYSTPETVESILLLLTTSYSLNVLIQLQPVVEGIFHAVVLICSPILFIFLIARLMPRYWLTPTSDPLHIKDRGIQKFLFPQGRAIVYQPSVDIRPYIPQYILSDNDGQRFLKCNLDTRIKAIRYRILPFDADDRPLPILEIEDPVYSPGISHAVPLPMNTAYVSICLQEVNGARFSANGNVGLSLKKVAAYGLTTLILTVLESYALKQSLVFFANLIFGYWGVATLDFGRILLPALLLGILCAALVFFCQYSKDQKFIK